MKEPLAVLIVEDVEQEVELLVHDLSKHYDPLEYAWVYDEPGMLAALQSRTWHSILCDYGLPLLPWPRPLNLAMEYAPFTPFIVLSRLSDTDAQAVIKDGASAFIDKRVGPMADDLYKRIERERERLRHQQAGEESMAKIQAMAKRGK